MGLGFLPGQNLSEAIGVSADGSVVVGGSGSVSGPHRAVVWDGTHGAEYVQDVLASYGVNLKGWTLEGAEAISAGRHDRR